jgi:hypothetical protein
LAVPLDAASTFVFGLIACAFSDLLVETEFLFACTLVSCGALLALLFCKAGVATGIAVLARLLCCAAPPPGKIIFGKTAAAEPASDPELEKKTSNGVCAASFDEVLVFDVEVAARAEDVLALRGVEFAGSEFGLAEPKPTDGLAAGALIGAEIALCAPTSVEAASFASEDEAEFAVATSVSAVCICAICEVALSALEAMFKMPPLARSAGSRKDGMLVDAVTGVSVGAISFAASVCAIGKPESNEASKRGWLLDSAG